MVGPGPSSIATNMNVTGTLSCDKNSKYPNYTPVWIALFLARNEITIVVILNIRVSALFYLKQLRLLGKTKRSVRVKQGEVVGKMTPVIRDFTVEQREHRV